MTSELIGVRANLRQDVVVSRRVERPRFGSDPSAIGIRDLALPHFGDAVEMRPGEVPVFWACGVTPQAVVMQVKPPWCITHKPGHMFVTDLRDTELEGD